MTVTCPMTREKILEQSIKYRKALEEILITKPIVCDGNHQGDYACDVHVEIAKEALGDAVKQTYEAVDD